MVRLTISISEEDSEYIESKVGDGGEYESKSAFVRDCLRHSQRTEELESEVERLQRKLTAANQKNTEISELANYVSEERRMQAEERQYKQRLRQATLIERLRYLVWGYDG